jgi:hypothetical protein
LTIIKCGFYVHFKKNILLKKTVENGAKDEFDKTWADMKNLIVNISEDYKAKRESNE